MAKKKSSENGLYQKINKIFKQPPMKRKTGDRSGRTVTLQHRVGDKKTFSVADLMQITGIQETYLEDCKRNRKVFKTDSKGYRRYEKMCMNNAKANVSRTVKAFVSHLASFYKDQNAEPVAGWLPDGNGENRFFIQGFLDTESSLIIAGDNEHVVGALEWNAARARAMADKFAKNRKVAENILMHQPGLNDDLKARLKALEKGEVSLRQLKDRN